ncbi:MAG: hypothetical protein K9N06_13325 [Candidatus Cloacimonetes bacterium]|nr:hypothetical protein [Candidatus Cloacimonadota bacterium]
MKIILIVLMIILLSGCATALDPRVDPHDGVRLRHLRYYGDVLEEYYKIAGKYPFEGEADVPIYVKIISEFQTEKVMEEVPPEYIRKSAKEFQKELEKVLDRSVSLRYDPKDIRDQAPVNYSYTIDGSVFYFAVFLSSRLEVSRKITEKCNKLELTNKPVLNQGQVNYRKVRYLAKQESEYASVAEQEIHFDTDRFQYEQPESDGLCKNLNMQVEDIYI